MADFDSNLKHLGEDFTADVADDPIIVGEANAGTEAANPEEGQQQPTPENSQEQQTAKPDSNSGKPDSGKQQGKETQGQKPSGPKDLVLPDGTVIKGGAERRFYEQHGIAKQQLSVEQRKTAELTQQLQTVQTKLQTLEQTAQSLSGIPLEQQAVAAKLYQDLARDPVGTATKLLAELKAKGYSIDGIGGAVDTAAIQQMLHQSRQTETPQGVTQEQIQRDAQAEVGQFFANYPDAVMHDEILAEIVTANPNMDLQEAYFQLRSSVANRGLDWSMPIKPQLQQMQQQQQQTQQPPQRKPTPMLSGRNGTGAIVEEAVNFSGQAGETFDDIIRAAMADGSRG